MHAARLTRWGVVLAVTVAALAPATFAADGPTKTREEAVNKAIAFLSTKGQAADGSFSAQAGPAVTGVIVAGILKNGRGPDDPAVAKALKYLEGFVQKDGGIYKPGSLVQNYETSMAIVALSAANKDKRYDKTIKAAAAFIKGLQWTGDEGQSLDQASTNFGGAGYGNHKRPDLSNTSFFLDALQSAGNGPDDEAVKRALVFVSRCQNLESEYNTTPFPAKNPDGGFYYTVAAGGNSQAGNTDNGGLRSYGSMTYAGLKSMIFAGVGPDDPRVKAALKWLQKNYTLQTNPGMGESGLFYYYHTLAKALAAQGQKEFVDAEGKKHDWRAELTAELIKRQHEDGSWTNSNARWMEGDANLVTGYVLLTLSYCKADK